MPYAPQEVKERIKQIHRQINILIIITFWFCPLFYIIKTTNNIFVLLTPFSNQIPIFIYHNPQLQWTFSGHNITSINVISSIATVRLAVWYSAFNMFTHPWTICLPHRQYDRINWHLCIRMNSICCRNTRTQRQSDYFICICIHKRHPPNKYQRTRLSSGFQELYQQSQRTQTQHLERRWGEVRDCCEGWRRQNWQWIIRIMPPMYVLWAWVAYGGKPSMLHGSWANTLCILQENIFALALVWQFDARTLGVVYFQSARRGDAQLPYMWWGSGGGDNLFTFDFRRYVVMLWESRRRACVRFVGFSSNKHTMWVEYYSVSLRLDSEIQSYTFCKTHSENNYDIINIYNNNFNMLVDKMLTCFIFSKLIFQERLADKYIVSFQSLKMFTIS